MRVLIAVLSSRMPPWGAMIDTSKATWDSTDTPGVETIYYAGEPATGFQDQVLGLPVRDTLHTMGHKNLQAWEWMLENREFDYMARVNASCFVHKPRLHAWCEQAPRTGFLCGGVVRDYHPGPRPWMWGGHQFIMSRDVVQALVDSRSKWPHREMDDVALSYLADDLGIPFTQGKHSCSIDHPPEGWRAVSSAGRSFMLPDWSALDELDTEFFFRVKQDGKRHEDAMLMHKLHDHYFTHQVQDI